MPLRQWVCSQATRCQNLREHLAERGIPIMQDDLRFHFPASSLLQESFRLLYELRRFGCTVDVASREVMHSQASTYMSSDYAW